MDGVTIIQTNVYRVFDLPALLICIIIISAVAIISLVALYMLLSCIKADMVEKAIVVLSMLLIVVFCAFGISGIIKGYNTIYTQYIVDIDNSVGFNEFFNKYKIVGQKGRHYIVEEIKE